MNSGCILLTGATGFLGRYLLRELLANGRRVAVLVRDARGRSIRERVEEVVAFACESLGRTLPRPTAVGGDLALQNLGIDAADRAWLARHCRAIVHAAGCVTLRSTPYGEPWKTNVDGTQRLLQFSKTSGISRWHHVSTAFVCGKRTGMVREDELDATNGFNNEYEQSKFEAERGIRSAAGMQVTFYRPSVIVGDSASGFTSSYHGIYRFLELGDRLAEPAATGRRTLALRLPFAGDERRNLVPVDWVAKAIVQILLRPGWHGLTYHLTAREPVSVRVVKEVAEDVLKIDGVRFAGRGQSTAVPGLEQTFLECLQEYRPYLGDDPEFDCRNTLAALPDLPSPCIDREILTRLIRFAAANCWGRRGRANARVRARIDCADYVERFFPACVGRSVLSQLPIDVTLGLHIAGSAGGHWTIRLKPGEAVQVNPEKSSDVPILYRTDRATFEAIVRGRETPQQAFFDRKIEIFGDVEMALKLAVLFSQFVKECPYPSRPAREEVDAVAVSG